jgi:uncharacterized membrane protein
MIPGSLSFAAKEWLWPAAAIFAVGLFLIFRSYARTSVSPGLRALSTALKVIGLALILSILLEPTWTTSRPREGANLFALVADNSMGLQVRDTGERKTRGELLRDLLFSDQSAWQGKLEEMFQLRRYLFDSRLESARDFAGLNFEGRETELGHALKSLSERFQGQPLAGVLLFTDGNATDLEHGFSQSGLPPIYPVLIGKESNLSDLALNNVSVGQTVFEDAPVTLTANVAATGFPKERIKAQVTLNGKIVAEQMLQAKSDKDQLPLRFELKPERPGLSFYELRVALADAQDRTNLTEATLYNNSRLLAVDRGKGPHRILYVSGRPNWEYKFMNRAVSEDPQLQLVGLIRIAKREPKFTFRGRAGESSNPLFRGFNKGDEETERYDQPVLIRLNTKDEVELRAGFPKVAEDLYGYEGLIIDDLESEFFTAEQLMLIQRYVSERGGGFLMLGGVDTLQDGKYAHTAVGDMLPVYLDRLPETPGGETFKLDLTREGWLQPWIRLRSTEQEERGRLEGHPDYQVLNKLREVKPGASVLATVRDNLGNHYPAVAVQRFGNGRVGTIAVGDLWRGGLESEKAQEDLQKGWRQMLRWLISDVPQQCDIRQQPSTDSEGAIELLVRARDKKFQPMDNASVQITVTAPTPDGKTNVVTLTGESADKEPGLYRATYVPREPGAYRVAATVNDSTGVRVAEVETGWSSEPLAKEFASLVPNRSLLEEIARKTGGEVILPNRLDHFVSSLNNKKAPIVETYSYPLWHKPLIFALALLCFISEWGIRRLKGLA